MAILMRRGADADFDASKIQSGELAVTTDGTEKIYVGFAKGKVKELVKKETFEAEVNKLSEQINNLPSGGTAVASVEPAIEDIPKVFFIGTAPTTKAEDELPLTMEYISKTKRIFSYVTLKVQGDTSASNPTYKKKNYNLKMFSDEARSEKLKCTFRNWSKTHKYCLKANWIDHTHARNIVNGRLWGQVVKSRSDYESYPTEYKESANSGAVDGFPIKVYINGIYQGIYTWNIRKDGSMFNMDDETGIHSALIADGVNAITAWRELPTIGNGDWTDELNDTVPDAVKTSFQNAYSFVMNSTDEEFVANIEQHFYLSSLIDYYIFVYSILMYGGLAKSQTMFTYDATKYLANIYDMDTTWALYWNGASFINVETACPEGYEHTAGYNLLYERLVANFPDRIKERYAELRSTVLSDANIINEFERFMDVIPLDLYAEDFAETTANGAFTEIPSKDTNNLQKLRDIIVKRMAYCDEQIPLIGTGEEEPDVPEDATLTNISATYTGGEVAVGTALSALSGITVTATYSDGSTATVTDYTLSGAVAEGTNTITVSYGGLTATFTVIGVAADSGEALYPFINNTNTSITGALVAEVTNGNHVKVTNTSANNVTGHFVNASNILSGNVGTDASVNYQEKIFTLSSGDAVEFKVYGGNLPSVANYGLRKANGNTSVTELSLSSSGAEVVKEVTLTADYDVGCVFFYGTIPANSTIEFDVSLIVNNQRYI